MKIFLGAAPGVGKTYEMLTAGRARRRDGIDVVIGVVETHGRAETAALTLGYETVPRRAVPHEAHTPDEMDLDAILARAPGLVLVDELAHSNALGSRHPKRHHDVEDLLAAGIDVYSTVNIQHLESLNDVVASFTRVRVRETVPDSILETAEIEVVDLPPDELIDRLKAGKIYLAAEATRALSHFFSKSNLSALRELALRRAAQAVDAQMLDHVRALGVGGTWAGGERVVVAVNEQLGADGLVRATKRIADALRAPWTAVYIETPRARGFGEAEHRHLAAVLALAAQLGGQVASVPAASILEGLKAFVADARATQLVVGKSVRSRWFELRHRSIVDRLVCETTGLAIHVLPLADMPHAKGRRVRPRAPPGVPGGYLWTTLMVAGVTAIAGGLLHILNLGNVALLYLLPVMAAASLFGLRTGLFAGLASSLAYNFFFLPPTRTLTISNPENVVSIIVLLGVALATSQLTARVRAQADIAAASARTNAALAGFVRQLSTLANPAALAGAICDEIGRLFDLRTVMLVADPPGLVVQAANAPDHRIEAMEIAAAQWAHDTGTPAGRGSATLTASEWFFQPLRSGGRTLAILGLAREDGGAPVRSDQLPLLASLVDQASLVLERLRLEIEMRDLDAVRERDRLRAALLSSVSHDLRTPLTSIMAAAADLRRGVTPELIATIESEADRLNRFVANLLDMARVEAGALRLRLEPVDLLEAVAGAARDARHALDGHALRLDLAPDLPLVEADPQLLHHILLNLLDNAGRYADPGTPIVVSGQARHGAITLAVLDEGPGLPAGSEIEIFETFRRLAGSDRAAGGTGLGLAIVKAFAEAMGLSIEAGNRDDRAGARFTLFFPHARLLRGVAGEAVA